jgi:hypothetical protein
VRGLTAFFDRSQQIKPEVFPFVIGPTVIPLKAWDSIRQPVTHQLSIGIVLRIEIRGRHKSSSLSA